MEGLEPRQALRVEERRLHRDRNGFTVVYACGCVLIVRGGNQRRTLCDRHGSLYPGDESEGSE